jgi:integrase/recombinase XerD
MSGGPYGRGKAPERTCLKRALWPEEDQRLWAIALEPEDPFSDSGGTRADHRPLSNQGIERGYGRWLTHLARKGLLEDRSPADRITPAEVKGYIAELEQLGRNSTIRQRLSELRQMAMIMGPGRDWAFIKRLASKIRSRAATPSRKHGRIVGADELYALGLNLMNQAMGPHSSRRSAVLFRDGLIIALLALRPLRRCNMANLTLGRDVISVAGTWMIILSPALTKTHVALEYDWPGSLVEALEAYLRVHRPLLQARKGRWKSPAGDRLWLTVDGSPVTQMALYDRVIYWTTKAFGKSVNPHLFRDSAATSLAINDPVHVLLAAPLLGHRTFKTTERSYIQAQTLQAHRQFTAQVSELRRAQENNWPNEIDEFELSGSQVKSHRQVK